MEKVYIFGHRNPDTDAVTSSIVLSYLKKNMGINAEPRVLGQLNDETKFVLDRFKVEEPKYLNDVKLKIKDVLYRKNDMLDQHTSIEQTYNFLKENNITGVPIVDQEKKFLGIITAKNILKSVFENSDALNTSYDNILKSLEAKEILRFDDEIKGKLNVASYRSTTFLNNVVLNSSDILIVGDRHSIIESAVNSKIKLLVLTEDSVIKDEHIKIAKENKVNIIKTPFNAFKTIRCIFSSNYIKNILSSERSYSVEENEYYDEFLATAKKLGFNNYPVVDSNNVCKGLLRLTEENKLNKHKVILVDHNESSQSALGLDEADILEVVDHHKIGDISTSKPISFRNMAVGSTNTILYFLFKENNCEIPYEIAGLMLSGIISDTLSLTSPTTTSIDKHVVSELEKITNLNYKEYGNELFRNSLNLDNKSLDELLNLDMKIFKNGEENIKVAQINTLSTEPLLEKKEELLEEIEKVRKAGYTVIFMITDIIKNGSYILYSNNAESKVEKICGKKPYQGIYVEKCVSRKMQIVPYIMD